MIAPGPDPESMVVQLQSGERIHYLAWPGPQTGSEKAGDVPERLGLSDEPGAPGAPGVPGVPMVLIHGLTRTAWTWLPIGRRLAARHPVVAPDLRGHGASEVPAQAAS